MQDYITPEILQRLLRYDPETGILFWRERGPEDFKRPGKCSGWNAKYAGKPAFKTDDGRGYLQGKILGMKLRAHRVAWAVQHGQWPAPLVDHKNRKKDDNRLANMREATHSQNAMNKAPANGERMPGVIWHKQRSKWQVRIKVGDRYHSLGLFTEFDEAVAARKDAEWAYALP